MIRRWHWVPIIVAAGLVLGLVTSCTEPMDQASAPVQATVEAEQPTGTPTQAEPSPTNTTIATVEAEQPTSTPTQAGQLTSASSGIQLDLDAIFPPGEGRELVIPYCTSCHGIGPIVILQMAENEWERSRLDHRDRVVGLPDEQFDTLFAYLAANFNPDKPVPELPPELLEDWTDY